MNRDEWLAWRKSGIGSSDAPSIMGVSKYRTILDVYEDKVSDEINEDQSFVMDLGNEAEPRIRSLISMLDDVEYTPCLIESAEFPFLRWSGDGISPDKKTGIEIKLAGKEIYEEASSGRVSECYWPQVQHGIMIGNLDVMKYVVYPMSEFRKTREVNSNFLKVISVVRDKDYCGKLLAEEIKFWDHVQKKKPPQVASKEAAPLKGQAKLLARWKRLKAKSDAVEAELESVRNEIIEAAKSQGHTKYLASGVRLIETARAGAVDYSKVPELKGIDLDQYRKKGSVSWRIELVED